MLSVLIRDRVIAAPIPDLRPSRGPRVASDTGLASIAENGYEDQSPSEDFAFNYIIF